jgi:circadian clock protein KaiC
MFTRQGLEEYITDAVIALDHRVSEQISTRRIRVVKYRGSMHGTNEYPFLIDRDGITVLPVTSLLLEHSAPDQRVSSGLPALDGMLGGPGFYRGSTVLLSGTAGTGKTTLAAHFVDAACKRGERCLYFLFEESPQQMVRNMRSAGVDVGRWVDKGLLQFHADRPTAMASRRTCWPCTTPSRCSSRTSCDGSDHQPARRGNAAGRALHAHGASSIS